MDSIDRAAAYTAPIGETSILYPGENAQPEQSAHRGKAFLAFAGAMLCPGGGHFIAGSYNLGLLWFSLAISIVVCAIGVVFQYPQWIATLVVLVPLFFLIEIGQLLDAAQLQTVSQLDAA